MSIVEVSNIYLMIRLSFITYFRDQHRQLLFVFVRIEELDFFLREVFPMISSVNYCCFVRHQNDLMRKIQLILKYYKKNQKQ